MNEAPNPALLADLKARGLLKPATALLGQPAPAPKATGVHDWLAAYDKPLAPAGETIDSDGVIHSAPASSGAAVAQRLRAVGGDRLGDAFLAQFGSGRLTQ